MELDSQTDLLCRIKKDDYIPIPIKWVQSFRNLLNDLNTRGGTVCIEWDTDTDGIMSGSIMNNQIRKHYPNIKIINYMHKTKVHGVNIDLFNFCLDHEIDLLICVDCGSSDYYLLDQLTMTGIKVVVSDHHLIPQEQLMKYQSNHNILLCNASLMEGYEEISGATITLYLITEVTKDFDKRLEYMEMAVITIVSDICSTENINRRIMLNYLYGHYPRSPIIEKVQGNFNITRNFLISFSSKLNSFIRYEGPHTLMKVIENDFASLTEINFKQIKKLDTERINLLRTKANIFEFSNIVVAVFDFKDESEYLKYNVRNYIGILANKLASSLNKLAIVMMPSRFDHEMYNSHQLYTFSARDYIQRNAIGLFNSFHGFDANGHSSAFGGSIYRGFDFNSLPNINDSINNLVLEANLKTILTEDLNLFIRDNRSEVIKLSILNNIHRTPHSLQGFLRGRVKSKQFHKEIISDGIIMKSYDREINLYSKVRVTPIFNGKEIEYVVDRCK